MALFDKIVQLAQLAQAQRRMQVARSIIQTRCWHLVVPGVRRAVGCRRLAGNLKHLRVADHADVAQPAQPFKT